MPFEPPVESQPRLQRCDGALILGLARDERGATRVADLYQRDPCRALFPLPEPDDAFQAVMLTTSGGLTGGDRIASRLAAGPGVRAIVTTQAAEKIYRSRGESTRIAVEIEVGEGAWLEWLPQETILFDGACLARETRITLSAGARLLAAEILVFGRSARGERLESGRLLDRWRVVRDRRLAWADAIGWASQPQCALGHPAGFAGALAFATVVYAGPDASERLALAREGCAKVDAAATRAGATLVNGLLIARLLSTDAQSLRRGLAQLWCSLREAAGKLPPRLPRTWYT
jgi:urease accessory protein